MASGSSSAKTAEHDSHIPEETSNKDEASKGEAPVAPRWKGQYLRAFRWCGAFALTGWMTQHMLHAAGVDPSVIPKLLLAVGAALSGFAVYAAKKKRREFGDLLVSTPMIVSVLSLITLATMVGTLIPQRIRPAAFDHAYGSATGIMRALHLDDLFHSLWVAGLVALAATSLVSIAARRWPWTFPKWGYVGAHLGPVVILFGSVFGQIDGFKGRIDLEVGGAADEMVTQDWRTGQIDRIALPFSVRLDDFHIESHDAVYRLFVFKHSGGSEDNASFQPVLSIDPEEKEGRVAVDDRFAIQVDSYKASEGAGAERHVLVMGGAEVVVAPGNTYDAAGLHVTVGEYFPHFTYDLSTKKAGNVSDRPVNPALRVKVQTGGADGQVVYDGWLFANMPGFSMEGHQGGERDNQMPVYRHEGGGQTQGPTAEVSIFDGDKKIGSSQLATVNGKHVLNFADGKYVAVFRIRDTEAKNYFSKLSIIRNDQVVESREIFVNDPYTYGGYTFYQANYDPKNLRYSGIDVVRDPGLWFVYGGLVLMLFGVLHIFYLRTLGRRRKEAAA